MLVIGCGQCPSKKVIHAALAKAAEGRGLCRRGERAHRERLVSAQQRLRQREEKSLGIRVGFCAFSFGFRRYLHFPLRR